MFTPGDWNILLTFLVRNQKFKLILIVNLDSNDIRYIIQCKSEYTIIIK